MLSSDKAGKKRGARREFCNLIYFFRNFLKIMFQLLSSYGLKY